MENNNNHGERHSMNRHILVVEDNAMNRDVLTRILQFFSYQVCVAKDGGEGLELARAGPVDLVLLDMSLPVLNGWEVVRALKADPKTRPLPIIALTAHAMVGDKEAATAAGCDDYEPKPFNAERLIGKVKTLLGQEEAATPQVRLSSLTAVRGASLQAVTPA
jgi:CheY-like chemotaxis protein